MEFLCNWCKSKIIVNLIKKGWKAKATLPVIEYCVVCGMSEEMIKSTKVKNG